MTTELTTHGIDGAILGQAIERTGGAEPPEPAAPEAPTAEKKKSAAKKAPAAKKAAKASTKKSGKKPAAKKPAAAKEIYKVTYLGGSACEARWGLKKGQVLTVSGTVMSHGVRFVRAATLDGKTAMYIAERFVERKKEPA